MFAPSITGRVGLNAHRAGSCSREHPSLRALLRARKNFAAIFPENYVMAISA